MIGLQHSKNSDKFAWYDKLELGYYEVENHPYDADYFNKYVGYEKTERGKALNDARVALVRKHYKGNDIVDIGVGSCHFQRAMNCMGYDINDVAIKALGKAFFNPYHSKIRVATFWDSLEHIRKVDAILRSVTDYVLVSLPIFENREHAVSSKHFRPDEHCWYFTDSGFKRFMFHNNFIVIEENMMETELGREDIKTYVLRRKNDT